MHNCTFESLQFKGLYVEDYCIYYTVLSETLLKTYKMSM